MRWLGITGPAAVGKSTVARGERGDDRSWVARHFDRIDWRARRGLVIDTTTRSPAEVAAEVIERTDADSE